MTLALTDIRLDYGTQTRVGINDPIVAEYARLMQDGTAFPPVVVFRDEQGYYIVDGNHRYLAAQRIGRTEIEADVHEGTKPDALWFALGANKAHGLRLTGPDLRRAAQLAIEAFPERPCAQIAQQLGCHPSWVTRVKRGSATTSDRIVTAAGYVRLASTAAFQKARVQAEDLLRQGQSIPEVSRQTGIGRESLYDLRRTLGLAKDMTHTAVRARHARMKEMAAQGHTSAQIAAAVGMSAEGVRERLRTDGVPIHADRVMGKLHRHDANRIVSRIVLDAENLLEGLGLIDYRDLERAQIADWVASLKKCREQLSTFIRRLSGERSHNGEAA